MKEILKYLELNPSKDIPYHNNKHMLEVYKIAKALYLEEAKNPTSRSLTIIKYSALFHDFGHSGGKLPDSDNIQIALECLEDFEYFKILPSTIQEDIKSAIRCTEFPFVREPKGLVQECLRDADLLYTVLSGDPELVLSALGDELGYSREEMAQGQEAFMKRAKFYTKGGAELFKKHSEEYLNLIKGAV